MTGDPVLPSLMALTALTLSPWMRTCTLPCRNPFLCAMLIKIADAASPSTEIEILRAAICLQISSLHFAAEMKPIYDTPHPPFSCDLLASEDKLLSPANHHKGFLVNGSDRGFIARRIRCDAPSTARWFSTAVSAPVHCIDIIAVN